MQLPQIRLESKYAKIGMRTSKPVQDIQQTPADLSIKQLKADLKIRTLPGKLTIDQTQARADVDLKSIARRIEEFSNEGYQALLDGIARRAQEGDQIMKVENGGHPIAEQAEVNSKNPIYDFNIGWVPSHGSVKINYLPSEVNIDVTVNKPIIEPGINKAKTGYTPGKTNIYLEQQNSLVIDFDNLRFIGINYEQKI
ncbi:hypothetical protein IMZ08_03150 [Bacillus luteolus]|uniref:Uncharacterized protein n=1 Tax=Litchfieldia luteola TaxID=682179 RepID=A0ABR9QEX7_9BACI|nr:DUF6470 family protein [Cytobacillus luteolus]MBE4907053.1 hypothetical protein [Cytobacillus luteolus]MBP1943480.1 hypothetical protein [Cytobacillus luteolus]